MSDPSATGGGTPKNDEDEDGDAPLTGAAAFRFRDFRFYFVGKFFAYVAMTMVTVAVQYQVYDRTGNPMDLAYIGLASFAPAFGLALFTGYVSDLFDRRLVLTCCYAVMLVAAVFLLLFTLSETREVWPAFLIITVMGTGRAFYQPASNALVPNLVPVKYFPNAVSWNTGANKIASVIGPALSGVFYIIGPEVVYGIAATAFFIGCSCTIVIRTRTKRVGKEPTSLQTLLAGLRFVYKKKIIFGSITLDLFVVIMGGVTALLPIFAKDILEVGPSGAGLLRSATAFGAVVAAVLLTQIAMTRSVGTILYVTTFIYGFATLLFGFSHWFWLSMIAMAAIGASDMVSVYIRSTLLQIATPDEMRGRVSAVNAVFTGASNEIGEFRAGTMAAFIGAVPAALFGGIGAVIVTAVCWKLFPALAKIERMDRHI
ncbi:MAG: MFS family permease [Alphaproteobacteria bacterium]